MSMSSSQPAPAFNSHPSRAPGFASLSDPFAGISQSRDIDDDNQSINFEDTYDGLGDQLDEADDDFNDDTFGDGGSAQPNPSNDFDFFGSTNKVSDAINDEAVRFQRQNHFPSEQHLNTTASAQRSKPYKSGYEVYSKPGYLPDLQVDPSLWSSGPPKPKNDFSSAPMPAQQPAITAQKKMMSLEEVEAAMRAMPKKPSAPLPAQQPPAPPHAGNLPDPAITYSSLGEVSSAHTGRDAGARGARPVQPREHSSQSSLSAPQPVLQRRTDPQLVYNERAAQAQERGPHAFPGSSERPQGQRPPQETPIVHSRDGSLAQQQPRKILQNPKRYSGTSGHEVQGQQAAHDQPIKTIPIMRDGRQVALPIITHPSQLAALSDEQREIFMAEEAKRAKRNHKIYLLSKGNGLMTPQDKNFITRIQLQQLMTATGNVHDREPDVPLAEDFYYQVYNQIENRPRQTPHQPLSNFAQTYLYQTGTRQGGMHRRHNRGDNHMQRMQQQVQRAVEAAKAKPKNKQLVIEGSLGKISFSNAKTPKPLLNIKPNEKVPQASLNATDRKTVLKNIEAVYTALMGLVDHNRNVPPGPYNEDDPTTAEPFILWRQRFKELNQELWSSLKVLEPIVPNSTTMHPFIAFLAYPKGKKAIPRVFSLIDQEQRLTILTIIMIQLDSLDVVRSAQPQNSTRLSSVAAGEQTDIFLQTVMPSLFSYVTEAPLNVIIGLVGLVIERVNVAAVARSRVGLEILTMLLSQAEIIRKGEASNEREWEQWLGVYNRLFDTMEPLLQHIFPGSVSVSQDVYVWQFLATIGTGANPEQQQRLVLAVKDRVMDTIQHCKTLPPEMALRRRGNVNLFMQAIGLDVDLLDN